MVVDPGWRPLAMADGKPIWARTEADGMDCEIASALPLELEDHEFLRDHLSQAGSGHSSRSFTS